MRISVAVEANDNKMDFCKVAEFNNIYHAGLLIKAMLDDADELGKTRFMVDVDFPETKIIKETCPEASLTHEGGKK